MCVYIALKVGREGWGVVTGDLHRLVHFLQHLHYPTFMFETKMCKSTCEPDNDHPNQVVPRLRPRTVEHYPDYEVRNTYPDLKDIKLILRFSGGHEFLRIMEQQPVYYYTARMDTPKGWFLVAGFSAVTRKHWAAKMVLRSSGELIGFMRDEDEERDFLVTLRPLLNMCSSKFLSLFLRINILRYDEAIDIINSKMSLKETAFLVMLRLPLIYLREHLNDKRFYNSMTYRKTIPRIPERELKNEYDVIRDRF